MQITNYCSIVSLRHDYSYSPPPPYKMSKVKGELHSLVHTFQVTVVGFLHFGGKFVEFGFPSLVSVSESNETFAGE